MATERRRPTRKRKKTLNPWFVVELAVLLGILLVIAFVVLPTFQEDTPPVISNTTGTTLPQTTEPAPTWMTFPESRELTAQQAFVYDVQAKKFTFLLGKETDRVYPASITKLFTAYVALQFLTPEQEIPAGEVLDMVGAGSSVAKIEKGDVLTAEQLVEAMLLPSGNDAAYMLADAAGRAILEDDTISAPDAVAAFLKEMNGQARAMGLSGTHFTNPDGYHSPNHYTTFADLVKIGEKVISDKTIMKYAVVESETLTLASGEKQWKNTNQLVNPASEYYCPFATGLKTGQTPSAGSCLLSSFDYEGRQWIIGVFDCPDIPDRFADTLQLFNETIGAQK